MLLSKKPITPYIPGIAWFFLLLYFICMPPSNIPKVDSWYTKFYPDKWVHAVLFGVLVFLFIYGINKSALSTQQKNNWALKILLAAIIWGLATEFIQKYFVPGRFFDWYDWLADSIGAFIAYVFAKKRVLNA
jgi:hypothetical protein